MPWMPVEVLEPPAATALSSGKSFRRVIRTGYKRETCDATRRAAYPDRTSRRAIGRNQQAAALRAASPGERPGTAWPRGRRRPEVSSLGAPPGRTSVRTRTEKAACTYTIALEDRDGPRGGDGSRQFHVQADASAHGDERNGPRAICSLLRPLVSICGSKRETISACDKCRSSTAASAPRAPPRWSLLVLYEGPPQAAARSDARSDAGGERRTINRGMGPAGTLASARSTQLTVYAAATDYRSQTGQARAAADFHDHHAGRIRLGTPCRATAAACSPSSGSPARASRDARVGSGASALQLQKAGPPWNRTRFAACNRRSLNCREIVACPLPTRADLARAAQVSGILSDMVKRTSSITSTSQRRMQGSVGMVSTASIESIFLLIRRCTDCRHQGARRRSFTAVSVFAPTARDVEDDATPRARASEHQQKVIESLECDPFLPIAAVGRLSRRFQREVSGSFSAIRKRSPD